MHAARQRPCSPGRDILRHVPFLSFGVATSPMTSHAVRLHSRDGHVPLRRRFAAEEWVKPTEATGAVEEAHRRWPKGRSEQGLARQRSTLQGFRAAARFCSGCL